MDYSLLKLILNKIRRYYSISFDGYKQNTIIRITLRRMLVNNISDLGEYIKFIDSNEQELKILYQSFLIGVTDFFRDEKVFNYIKTSLLPQLVENKDDNTSLRIWIPGCSTGQEVYSYAILFFEALKHIHKKMNVKILATDITESGLEYGSAGEYTIDEVENVPMPYLNEYFEKAGGHYKVKQSLRKRIVFIKHDIIKDLPFTKIDLISCRNLMIYLKSEIQGKIIQNFYKSLNEGGLLILGQSETTNFCKDCHFSVIDNSYKIYKKSVVKERKVEMVNKDNQINMPSGILASKNQILQFSKVDTQSSKILENVLGYLIQTGVVVDDSLSILYSFGYMEQYYTPINGKATLELTKLVKENIRLAIISGIKKSSHNNRSIKYANVQYSTDNKNCYVDISITPLSSPDDNKLFIIDFLSSSNQSPKKTEQDFNISNESKEYIQMLESELSSVKGELQSLIEELELSNEELKVSNEKLFASNEELQSTNEEINTANEELYSMNVKYEKKISELSQTTNDLNNLIYSMNVATIFLDMDLIIRKYTPNTTQLFNIIPHDLGRPIHHITSDFINSKDMMQSIDSVLKTGKRTEREVFFKDEQAFFENVFPYRNEKDELKGVIVSYYNISELKRAQKNLVDSEQRYRELFENMNSAFALHEIILDENGKPYDYRFLDVNSKFEEILGYNRKEILGKTVKELFPKIESYWIETYSRVALTGESVSIENYTQQFDRHYKVSAYSPVPLQFATIFNDITEQVKTMEKEKQMSRLKEMVANVNKIAFWELNATTKALTPDDHWKVLMGVPEENTKPYMQYWIDKVHPEDTYAVDSFIKFCNTPSQEDKFDCTYRLFNENTKRYIWIHCVSIVTERDEGGYPLHLIGLDQDISKQKDVEKALGESKKWLEKAQKTSKISYFRYNFRSKKYIYPKELADLLGFEHALTMESLVSFMLDDYKEEFKRKLDNLLNRHEDFEYDFGVEVNNEIKYLHAYVHIVLDKEGTTKEVFGIMQDITERVEAQSVNKKLSKINQRLQKVNNLAITAGDLLIWNFDYELFPNGEFFYISENYATMLGLETNEKGFVDIRDDHKAYCLDKEGQQMQDVLFSTVEDALSGKIDSYSNIIAKHCNLKTKQIMYFEHYGQVEERFEDGRAKTIGGFLRDITSEYENKRKIQFFAEHDLLTGVYNRNYFETYFNSEALGCSYTIFICDIDGLKLVNDAFGHLTGDEYLKLIANILTDVFEKDALVARIGGDEFAVISYNTDATEIELMLRLIKQRLTNHRDKDVEINIDISIGYEIVINNNKAFNEAFIIAENIMYRRKLNERSSRKSNALDTIMSALNAKTEETKAHCERLQVLASETLKKLGFFKQSDLQDIMILANVHDIGKITIAEDILSKNGPLTDEERSKIMQHSEAGYKIIRNINDLEEIAKGVLYHHERVDGNGYPHGLKGDEIPLFARIICVVDSYDAMTSDRAYRKAMSKEDAIEELIRCCGTQFDPLVVQAFLEVINESLNTSSVCSNKIS